MEPKDGTTPQENEQVESPSALDAAAQSRDALSGIDHQDLFSGFDPDDEEDIEDDYNDPSIEQLDDEAYIGGKVENSLFGNRAESWGRATSPRLYSQAANFPQVAQLRIWKIENGIPCGLGAIEAQATEEDLVLTYFHAMPKRGEGRCQFKLRPITDTGKELGKEITLFISEHHAAIQKKKRMEEYESEDNGDDYRNRRGRNMFDEPGYQQQDPGYSRLMERMMQNHESSQEHLSSTLEDERNRIRHLREEIANERVDLATNAAQGVQEITSKLMAQEAERVAQAQKAQAEQQQMLLTSLTSIFAQQQTMMQGHLEAQRMAAEQSLERERQRSAAEARQAEDRRKRDELEMQERRRRENAEFERKMLAERQYLELRLQRDREEGERTRLRDREEAERKERWFLQQQEQKERRELIAAKEIEQERMRQHDRKMAELKVQETRDREHAERMMVLSKQELANNAMGGLGELLPKAAGMLKNMGMEPTDIVQRIFAPQQAEDGGSMWAETLPKLLGAGADVARAVVASKAGAMPMVAPPQMVEPGGEYQISDDLYQRKKTPPPLPQNEYFSDEYFEDDLPDKYQPETIVTPPPSEGDVISFKSTKLFNPEPKAPSQSELLNQAGMDLGAQKTARDAMRNLVQQLATNAEPSWVGLITQAISQEIQIYHYIKAITVRSALKETGAAAPLIEKIVFAMKNSGMVPSDIPYGE